VNADISCAGIVRENNNKKNELIKYTDIQTTNDIREKFILSCCPKYNFVWNKLYKKSVLTENNIIFVPGMIYEDMCFTPDILENSNLLVVCPNTFYHYWKHKDTLIKGDSDKARADKINGTEYLRNKCKRHKINLNNKNELLYKQDFSLWGILLLRENVYRATRKFCLFGLIPFIEIRRKV
jgi:hypothetical protein